MTQVRACCLTVTTAVLLLGTVVLADIAPPGRGPVLMPKSPGGIVADRPTGVPAGPAAAPTSPKTVEVSLAQGGNVFPGDTLALKGTLFRAVYDGLKEDVACASPTNCGAGYSPPSPRFTVSGCKKNPCEYSVLVTSSGYFEPPIAVKIQSIETCLSDPALRPEERIFCYRRFVLQPRTMRDCDAYPAGPGRDLCLSMVRGPEAGTVELCRRLTEDTRDKANCFREAANRAGSSAVCKEISAAQRNERDHCFSELGIKQMNMDLCLQIDGNNTFLLEECVKASISKGALRYRTTGYCDTLKAGAHKDFCRAWTVPYRKEADLCAGISDGTAQRTCSIQLAHQTNDEGICSKLEGIAIRSECCQGIAGGCKTVKP